MPEPEPEPETEVKPVRKLKRVPRLKRVKPKPKPELPSHASDMRGPELWAKLQKIGFSQSGFARTVRVSGATVRSWIGERSYVPETIAILVNLMLKTKTTPETLGPANRNEPT